MHGQTCIVSANLTTFLLKGEAGVSEIIKGVVNSDQTKQTKHESAEFKAGVDEGRLSPCTVTCCSYRHDPYEREWSEG